MGDAHRQRPKEVTSTKVRERSINLLLTLLQSRLTRRWSFSGLAMMVRIVLMYYINLDTFLERPEEDMRLLLLDADESPTK